MLWTNKYLAFIMASTSEMNWLF